MSTAAASARPVLVVLGLLITIGFLVFVRRNERRLEEEAEHTFSGSLDEYSPMGSDVQVQRQEAHLRRDSQLD